jgi:hypothetical protein
VRFMSCNRHGILFATSSQEELDRRACGTHGRQKKCIQVFGRETCVKRTLGIHKCRWDDNIKKRLQEVGWGGMDWINPVQD